MDICRNVYIEDNINKNGVSKLIKKIKSNKPDLDLYVICVICSSNSLMEIFHYAECRKPHIKNKKYIVIGIAPDKNSALKLTVKILQDVTLQNIELSASKVYNYFANLQNQK